MIKKYSEEKRLEVALIRLHLLGRLRRDKQASCFCPFGQKVILKFNIIQAASDAGASYLRNANASYLE